MPRNAHGLGQQKLRVGGAVAAAALLVEKLQNIGVGGRLYGKVLPETLVPGKGGLQRPGIGPNAGLIVQVKGSGDLMNDLPGLLQGDKWGFLHMRALRKMYFYV